MKCIPCVELQLRWKSWLPVPCKQPQNHSVRSSEKSEPWRSQGREVAMRWAKLYGSLLAYHHDHGVMSNQQKIRIALPLTDFMPCFSDFPVTKETKCCFSFLWCPTVTRHKDDQTWSAEVRAVPRRTGTASRATAERSAWVSLVFQAKKVWTPKARARWIRRLILILLNFLKVETPLWLIVSLYFPSQLCLVHCIWLKFSRLKDSTNLGCCGKAQDKEKAEKVEKLEKVEKAEVEEVMEVLISEWWKKVQTQHEAWWRAHEGHGVKLSEGLWDAAEDLPSFGFEVDEWGFQMAMDQAALSEDWNQIWQS